MTASEAQAVAVVTRVLGARVIGKERCLPLALTLFVPGRPAPQGSKSFKGYRGGKPILAESSREVGPWRERIAITAHNVWTPRRVLSGVPVSAALEFVMPRPSGTPKATPPAVKRPDLDKLVRAVFDALTGPVLADDAAVVELAASKRLAAVGETPGVHITIRALPDRQAVVEQRLLELADGRS